MSQREPEFYTVDEVAGIWRVTGMTVRNMIRSGSLPGVKVGRSWRVPVSAVMRASDVMSDDFVSAAVRTGKELDEVQEEETRDSDEHPPFEAEADPTEDAPLASGSSGGIDDRGVEDEAVAVAASADTSLHVEPAVFELDSSGDAARYPESGGVGALADLDGVSLAAARLDASGSDQLPTIGHAVLRAGAIPDETHAVSVAAHTDTVRFALRATAPA